MDCEHARVLAFCQSQTEIFPAFQAGIQYLTMHYLRYVHPIQDLEIITLARKRKSSDNRLLMLIPQNQWVHRLVKQKESDKQM